MEYSLDPDYFKNENAQQNAEIRLQINGDFSEVLLLPKISG